MQSLQPGRTAVVTRMSSAQMEGKLLSITAESISVTWRGQPQVVARGDVYRVRIANIRRRHTLIGMAFGGGVLAVAGAAGNSSNRGLSALLSGGMGAGIGAAVGGAISIGPPLYQVAGPPLRAAGPAAKE